ncbi:MAG: cellulase family glycosylhydrolase [Lachnospira sp.]|nr:cellulase family glycosylhydrolase [Lachnospira sp.]
MSTLMVLILCVCVFGVINLVSASEQVLGDANGDGAVSISDVVALKKHLAGMDVDIDLNACEVTADRVVDIKDAVLLSKKLAGMDVVLSGGVCDSTVVEDETEVETGTANNVIVQFEVSNSWTEDGKSCVQYGVIITNNSDSNIGSWVIKVPLADGMTVADKWCCKAETDEEYLIIRPESYNGAIATGSSVNNIGIVIHTNQVHTITTYIIEIDGEEHTGQNPAPGGSEGETEGETGGNAGEDDDDNSGSSDYTPATPPEAYGGLHVVGTKLVDSKGNEIQLKGPSTHGLSWFPQYVNYEGFKTFRDDWGANVIRLAMYPKEYNGYLAGGNQTELKKLIDNGVNYATQLGMYVIIDWHVLTYNPNETKDGAIAFFDEMAKKYADNPNVIYEICNEPVGAVWSTQIKPYAESVISTIRKYDDDALIIVGTNTWSQDVHEVVGNKIDDHNVIYTLHFYAATHKDDLRNRMKQALDAGVPIFVSECSICDASGNGGIDYDSANAWIKLMDEYGVSYVAWNISNKDETSAFFKTNVSKVSGWNPDTDLTDTGKWWRKIFRGEY